MNYRGTSPEAAQSLLVRSFQTEEPRLPHQSPDCEISVLVPAHNETPEDILKQLSWVLRQQTDLGAVEIVYAVNNTPAADTDGWKDSFTRNQALLALPIFQNRQGERAPKGTERLCAEIRENLTVLALDMSSPGYWTEGCNVGVVRQRLLAEACLRFAANDKNGLLFFSDADTYFEDRNLIQTVRDRFATVPDLIAVPGAMTLEADLAHPESAALAENLERVKLSSKWHTLLKAWQRGSAERDKLRFYGPCMVMRAFEAAEAGGFSTEDRIATDVIFGERLIAYAAAHGRSVQHGRELGIGVINALRWSGRTRNNVLHSAYTLATDPGPMLVEPIGIEGTPSETTELTPQLLYKLGSLVCTLQNGEEYVDYMLHDSLIARARVAEPEFTVYNAA